MDGRIYARPWQGGLLSGGFEKNPKPIFTEGRNQLEIQNMQEDWDHFGKGESWREGWEAREVERQSVYFAYKDLICTIYLILYI